MAVYTNGDRIEFRDLPGADWPRGTVDVNTGEMNITGTSGGGGGGGGRTGSTQEVEIPNGVLIVAVGVIVAWALGVF